jgi:Fe/S biogenesis protein NfuA
MIKVTEAAIAKFMTAARGEGKVGYGLRVIVHGGGTARPEFALNFVSPAEARPDEMLVDVGELKVYADAESAKWLDEASIDFVDTLHESGFKVDAPHAGTAAPAGPVAEAVQAVLDAQINPAVAAHGGQVSLVGIENDTAYLRFGGGCQGCSMINVTLKQGVERMIFEAVPQITRVMDVTDHASGTNPYYQPAK